jgi:hypothetical protein
MNLKPIGKSDTLASVFCLCARVCLVATRVLFFRVVPSCADPLLLPRFVLEELAKRIERNQANPFDLVPLSQTERLDLSVSDQLIELSTREPEQPYSSVNPQPLWPLLDWLAVRQCLKLCLHVVE